MSANLRRLMVLLLGALLVAAPLFTRVAINRFNRGSYQPPAIGLAGLAVTPMPTPMARPAPQDVTAPQGELSQEPVWVDLAHFPGLDPSQFDALAAALAARGVGLRSWTSRVDPSTIETFEDFPDQSEDLALLLPDASGLVVVSPYFLWTPAEIALVEKFVADGGRLLLISDPDVLGDSIWNVNSLGEPFGVVFNNDYLYDLSKNDGNYTHFFQGEFLDQAARLDGSTVAFYGARSISGPVVSQARSADTTLSSLRSSLTRFTTLAMGGHETNGTAGNVLAMGDFDVLTEPYVARHDNHVILEFVADFLAGGQRKQTLPDFPDYLGKQVALVFGRDGSVDAELLLQGGLVQQRLEETGRSLILSSVTLLAPATRVDESITTTGTIPSATRPSVAVNAVNAMNGVNGEGVEPRDVIYLGTFQSADAETALLVEAGIHLVQERETPEAAATVTPFPLPPAEVTPTVTPEPGAGAVPPGETATSESPSRDTSAPGSRLLLEMDSGLRFLAPETVLILQQEQAGGSQIVAVLGNDSQAIGAGLNRLLYHRFDGCVNYAEMAICPLFSEEGAPGGATDTGEVTPSTSPAQPEEGGTPPPGGGERLGAGGAMLVVDDNDLAAPDEAPEAVIYLQTLTKMGFAPDLWPTADRGSPTGTDLVGYNWVIWSSGLYAAGGPDGDEQEMLWNFVFGGGNLTISGRNHPFGGESPKEASVIADVVTTGEVPELVAGFPDEPIELPAGLPPVVPVEEVPGGDGGPAVAVALRRGPDSADSGAPLMLALTNTGEPNPVEVRVLLLGMPLNWLPEGHDLQLVVNMASWTLRE
jgi:hypothetical protein